MLTTIVFHDIGRRNDGAEDSHRKASRKVYENNEGSSADPAVCFLIEYHYLADDLAKEYQKVSDVIRPKNEPGFFIRS